MVGEDEEEEDEEGGKWIRRGARTGREGCPLLGEERAEREERRRVTEGASFGIFGLACAGLVWSGGEVGFR